MRAPWLCSLIGAASERQQILHATDCSNKQRNSAPSAHSLRFFFSCLNAYVYSTLLYLSKLYRFQPRANSVSFAVSQGTMSSHFTPIKSVPNQAVDYLIMPYIIQPDCIIRNALRQKKTAFFPYLTTQKLQTCPRLLIKSAIAYRLHQRQHRSYRPIQSFRLSLSLHVAYIKESRRMACSRCQSKKLCVCVSFSLGPLLHAHLIMFVARLRSQNVRKHTFWHVRQQRLKSACASAQSDQSFLSVWRHFASLPIQNAHSEYSDETARMRRLIWNFAGRTISTIHFRTLALEG